MTTVAKDAVTPLHRNRGFSLLWAGAGFSYLGSRMTALVYPMLVLWGGGSTTTAGLLGFTALLPQLVVQLPAGAHVDRRDRRRLMLACELGCVLVLGSLAVPVALGRLWLPQLFAVAFVEGSLMVVYQVAERSAVPQLVAAEQLGPAYSRNEARTRAASLIGGPAGTELFAAGNAVPLLCSVAAHLASFATLLRIRTPLQAERGTPPGDVRSEITTGLSWLWRQHFLRAVLVIIAGTNMLYQMVAFTMLPLFHDEGRPKGLVGVVLACSAVGGLLGALTAARWMRSWSVRRILLAGTVVWAIVTPLLAVARNVVEMGALLSASGYVGGVFNVPAIVYLMRITPPAMQGRVSSSANLVTSGAISLGWVAAGLLLTVVTPRQGIGVVGAGMALIAACAVASPAIRGADGPAETKPLGLSERNESPVNYLRTYRPRPWARLRLVCLPHAGGAATAFRGWADTLPSWIELVCVQYPGRHDRLGEPFTTDVPTLVDEIVADLPAKPMMALFGHSMGATIAFEVARRMPPVHLFLSAPGTDREPLDFSTDHQLVAEVKRLGGAGAMLLEHPEIRRLALPAIRNDLKILAAHKIADGPPLDCPITVLLGDGDHTCSAEEAKRWAQRTSGEFGLRVYPGGHHYLEDMGETIVGLLADKLRRHVQGH